MMGNFEIVGDGVAGFRFRLTDGEGKVLVTSIEFNSKVETAAAIVAVRESAAAALVVDHSAMPIPGASPVPVPSRAEEL